jgi:hypothetical protein
LAASAILAALLAPATSPAGPLLLAVALLVLLVGAAQRSKPLRHGRLVDRVMVAVSTILLVAVGIKLATDGTLGNAIADVQLDTAPRGAVDAPSGPLPDIVIVMLDGFPGDAAARLAPTAGSQYDPDAFPTALTDLGFKVQRNSHSNYLLTPMTLSSMFDMRHLVDVPNLEGRPEESRDGRSFRRLLDRSSGLETLHRAGYELIWVDGGFSHIEARRVDRWIDHGEPTELEVRVLANTFAGSLLNALAPTALSDLHRERILTTLDDVTRLIDEPHTKPRFVFVHVASPHAPWVFGPHGERRTEGLQSFYMDPAGVRGIDRSEGIRRVFDQASFVADRTTAELSRLVDRDDPPAVVVFSDHGPGTVIDFRAPATTDLVERSSNFLATFTPGQPNLFDRFTTPVNILPTLFGGYLGLDVPRQPDTIYAWSDSLYNLFPVDVPGVSSR